MSDLVTPGPSTFHRVIVLIKVAIRYTRRLALEALRRRSFIVIV